MTLEVWFKAHYPDIPWNSAMAIMRLAEEGSTLPFIARYRKEQTGNMDEVAIQTVLDAKEKWDEVLKRQAFILGEIENQKKLTPELKEKISTTFELGLLEDIYLPYKQKRKTKATLAKEAGLQELADWIWGCGHGTVSPQPGQTLDLWALTFRNAEKGINEAPEAIAGAQDIIVEKLSEMPELRALVREAFFKKGCLRSQKGTKPKPNSKFENYFDYYEPVSSLLKPQNSHRYLAMRRGWMEEELSNSIGGDPKDEMFESSLIQVFETTSCKLPDSPGAEVLKKASKLAYKAHVAASIEGEVHRALKEVADATAIKVFSENVRKVLLSSPFGPKAVLGVDPGIRTGCKLALVNDSGQYIASTVINLQTEEEKNKVKPQLVELIKNASIRAVAVGNGTAGRETETFIRSALKEASVDIPVVMVSEAGASVYSASEVAREEFPDLDVTVRGAISIARRLQDPLAELVKTDPKSIGVGQYQHDVLPTALKRGLEQVVDLCVNSVGVNLNTASYHLLSHVSGIGPALAKAIVNYRNEKGLFKSRTELLEVPRFGAKPFEQAAGFLRIANAENPLDNTGVHPERYPALEKLAERLGKKVQELMGAGVALVKADKELLAEVGNFTFRDIVQDLEKPGRDPRETFVPFNFRDDIHQLSDLKPGLACPGIVTNVTNFGAFVDIGVHQDGLVHISQLCDRFVKDPSEVVSPGDRVQVRVIDVNLEKKQIALSMKPVAERRPEPRQAPAQANRGGDQNRQARPPQPQRPNQSRPGGGGARPQQPKRPSPQPPKPGFNSNAFAALAKWKDKK